MRGSALPSPGSGDGDAFAAALRSKAAGTKDATGSKGKDTVGKAFQTAHNPSGWDRKARWQRAVNLARDKMGATGMDDSMEKWGAGGKDAGDGAGGGDRRSASAQPLRRGSICTLAPGAALSGGAPGTIAELRTATALKEHLKRGRGARETGIQLATLDAGLDAPSEEDAAALVAQYDQRRQMLNGAPASPSRPAALSPADRVLRAWANTCSIAGNTNSKDVNVTIGGNPGSSPVVAVGGAGVVIGPPLTSGPGAQGLTPTNLSSDGSMLMGAVVAAGTAGGTTGAAAVHGLGLQYSGYASYENSAGPCTPTGMPTTVTVGSGGPTGLVPPFAGSSGVGPGVSIGSIAKRRFSECGSMSFSISGASGAGSGAAEGTVDELGAGGSTFPSVRRGIAMPGDASIIARPVSARRECLSALRGSVDSIPAAAYGPSAAAGAGAAGTMPERLASGVDSPTITSRSRGLSRQGSVVFLAPLENPPQPVLAVEASETSSSAASGGAVSGGGAVGGGGGSGGGAPQAMPRPYSAGRRFPLSVEAADLVTSRNGLTVDTAAVQGVDGGGTPASPFSTPTPLLRSLPHLQLPENISPTRLTAPDRTASYTSPVHGHGGGTGDLDKDRDSGSSMGRQNERGRVSPSCDLTAQPLLLTTAVSPTAVAALAATADGYGVNGACGNASAGGRGASSSASGIAFVVAAPMMPAPPPFLQDSSTILVGPRRTRTRTSVTGDGSASASPLRVSHVTPTPPPAGRQQAGTGPSSLSPPPQPPALTAPLATSYCGGGGGGGGDGACGPGPYSVTTSTPGTTPPASPLMQHIIYSPRLSHPMPATAAPSGVPAPTASATAAASAGGASSAADRAGMFVQTSPSSPWPTLSPAYRRATTSSPGTPTGGAGTLPTHFAAPQPPSSPPMYRALTPAPPHAPAAPGGQSPTAPGYRRASVTVTAAYSGAIGGAGSSILSSARTSTLGLAMAPPQSQSQQQPSSPAVSGAGSKPQPLSPGAATPASHGASAADATSTAWGLATSPAAPGLGASHPSRLASAFVGRPVAAGGRFPAGAESATGDAAAAAFGAVATAGGSCSTPISDTVLADLRAVVSEVEVELAREAEAQAVIRQAQAQALRNRIRMSESGKYRNPNNLSMPGDPWRKYG